MREGDAEEVGCAVRAFVDAMAREDFEGACSYFSKPARAFVLTAASATGLKTESCAAARAHLVKWDTDVDGRTLSAMWERARGFAIEVKVTSADRATVKFDLSPGLNRSELASVRGLFDELRLTKGLPMVREDGTWKVGMRGADDSTARLNPE